MLTTSLVTLTLIGVILYFSFKTLKKQPQKIDAKEKAFVELVQSIDLKTIEVPSRQGLYGRTAAVYGIYFCDILLLFLITNLLAAWILHNPREILSIIDMPILLLFGGGILILNLVGPMNLVRQILGEKMPGFDYIKERAIQYFVRVTAFHYAFSIIGTILFAKFAGGRHPSMIAFGIVTSSGMILLFYSAFYLSAEITRLGLPALLEVIMPKKESQSTSTS